MKKPQNQKSGMRMNYFAYEIFSESVEGVEIHSPDWVDVDDFFHHKKNEKNRKTSCLLDVGFHDVSFFLAHVHHSPFDVSNADKSLK